MQKKQRGDESPLIGVLEKFRRITSNFSKKVLAFCWVMCYYIYVK